MRHIDQILSSSIWRQLFSLVILLTVFGSLFFFFGNIFLSNEAFQDESALSSPKGFNSKFWYIVSRLLDPGYIGESKNKVFATIITIVGWIICTGLLIAIITNAYFNRIEKIAQGQARYKMNNHCVILGYNDMTSSIIKQIYSWSGFNKNSNFIVHTVQESKTIRARLKSHLPDKIEKKLFIYRGTRDSKEELEKLCLDKAKILVVLGEHGESGIDSRNVECLKLISSFLTQKSKKSINDRLLCYLFLENQTTFTLLQQFDLPIEINKKLDIRAFNLHETWANRILTGGNRYNKSDFYKTLDYMPIQADNSEKRVRFIIIGFNRMGRALAIQAARIAHFGAKTKTIITIVDIDLKEKQDEFTSQFPGYESMADVEIEFLKGDINSKDIRQFLIHCTRDNSQIVTIAVCLKDADKSLTTGLNLPLEIYQGKTPILIRQEVLHGFASVLIGSGGINEENRFENISFFGMLSDACDLDFERDKNAKQLHNDFLEIAKKNGRYSADNYAFQEWENLPEQFKWSNRYVVDIYPVKLRALKYNSDVFNQLENSLEVYGRKLKAVFDHEFKENKVLLQQENLNDSDYKKILVDIELLGEIEHNRWLAERIFAGWTYAPKKNAALRQSPYIVPYSDLSEEMKMYDREPSVKMFEILSIPP